MTTAFELAGLLAQCRASGERYLEFLRVPALSVGVYALPAGGRDPQRPHGQDEVYYVVHGRATLQVAADDRAVAAGSIIFVPAGVPHRFHTITEDLAVLVLFAPAETA